MSADSEQLPPVHVPGGRYTIGNDSIPQAGPRHHIDLGEFWIDRSPVTMAHFEVFVANGGYSDRRWWVDTPRSGPSFLPQGSVDNRCFDVMRSSKIAVIECGIIPNCSMQIPAVGLTWAEASALCRFFGARLPHESEWEVAMKPSTGRNHAQTESQQTISHFGCRVFLGCLEEWTAGAFTPQHWRGETKAEYAAIDSPYGICVRSSDRRGLYAEVSVRSSGDPFEASSWRTFRRLWKQTPSDRQLSLTFMRGNE